MVGTVCVLLVLGYFLAHERYRRPPKPYGPVEFARLRREAEAGMSDLAPRAILLAEREGAVAGALEGCASDVEARRAAEILVGEAAAVGFWERFVEVSALIEEDPLRAIEGMRPLPALLDGSLAVLERAEGFLRKEANGALPALYVERGEGDG